MKNMSISHYVAIFIKFWNVLLERIKFYKEVKIFVVLYIKFYIDYKFIFIINKLLIV